MKTTSIVRGLFLIGAVMFPMISARAQTPVEYKITGTVFDETYQVVERVRVCALPVDYWQFRQMPCGVSDSKGRFVIPAGRPSKYRILPEKSSAGYQWQQQEFYRNPALALLNVTLTETNPSANISVPLGEKNGTLTGRINDETTGLAVESARFTM